MINGRFGQINGMRFDLKGMSHNDFALKQDYFSPRRNLLLLSRMPPTQWNTTAFTYLN